MANTLKSQLEFNAVPGGGTATLPHHLQVNETDFEPDHIELENSAFDYVSSTSTTVTVINNSSDPGSCRVLCELWHTIERVFGDGSLNLPNKPFIDRGSAPPSTSAFNWFSFDYVATGLEGQSFTVPIPVAQPDALYQIRHQLGTVVRQFGLNLVDGSELVGSFQVNVSTEPELGDVIHFDVFNSPP